MVMKNIYTNNDEIIRPVAVKTLKDNYNQDAQTDFEREVEIISAFSHENILKLEGVVFRENESTPWMVFEFMQYGDLAQLLRSNSSFMRAQNAVPTLELNEVLQYILALVVMGE
ncbi:tyrosine-protein kinase transmembrane receptor Ror [Trichonephila clavata]|uniref:Tyrosine-protein kinase transmembrane receptor Ror n=1 Tax=Trichonephila clavata TaxID=2740835 RepID=A0A8X6J9A7_TRICU|nr:tyrosine-protein kinase transmembrane receptor Ror [Trichonephila clavata]